MPILTIPAEEANRNLKSSRASFWPDDRIPGDRLKGVAKVQARPSFQIAPSDRIMTLGSCFAREIEERLDRHGFDVPLFHVETLPEDRTGKRHDDVANKFTIQSIENELRWAAGAQPPPPERFFLETTNGLWHDAQLFHGATPLPLDRLAERRRLFQKAVAAFPTCRVVIVTLGLAEAWFDEETSLYLNSAPPPASVRRYPGRFRVDLLSCTDIVQSLERIHALLKAKGHPDLRMLITVSPVPLKATFTGEDAIAANTYSKATQRAACREFVARHADVDYFPSYEIVALTPRELAYERDNIHVSKSVVDHIMAEVFSAYAPGLKIEQAKVGVPLTRQTDELLRPTDYFRLIKHHLADRALDRAEEACRDALARFGADASAKDVALLRYLLGVTLGEKEHWTEAADELEAALDLAPGGGITAYRLGLCRNRQGRRAEALAAFARAVEEDPSRPEFGAALRRARARQASEAWRRLWPSGFPFRRPAPLAGAPRQAS